MGHDDATRGTSRRRRTLRLALFAVLGTGLATFGLLTVAYLLDPRAIDHVAGFAAAWWGSVIAVLVCAVAACACGDEGCDDGRYLGSLVDGLRAEWRRRG